MNGAIGPMATQSSTDLISVSLTLGEWIKILSAAQSGMADIKQRLGDYDLAKQHQHAIQRLLGFVSSKVC
jgi:hypothetical protein